MTPRADHFRLGMLFAAASALTFGMSGPLAKSLMEAGWSPTAAVLARLAGGALERLLFAAGAGQGPRADWWIALLILADGEALTTGFVVTGLAIYRPAWLHTFDEDRYLRPPGRPR